MRSELPHRNCWSIVWHLGSVGNLKGIDTQDTQIYTLWFCLCKRIDNRKKLSKVEKKRRHKKKRAHTPWREAWPQCHQRCVHDERVCRGMEVESSEGLMHAAWLPGPSARRHRAPEAEGHTHTKAHRQWEEIELPRFIIHETEKKQAGQTSASS